MEWAGQTIWVGMSAVEWSAQQEMSQVKRLVELRMERERGTLINAGFSRSIDAVSLRPLRCV